jgi:hypothetical protein
MAGVRTTRVVISDVPTVPGLDEPGTVGVCRPHAEVGPGIANADRAAIPAR